MPQLSEEETKRHFAALSKALMPMMKLIELREGQIADLHLAVSWHNDQAAGGPTVRFHEGVQMKARQ